MTDEELIGRACEVGAALLRRPGDLDQYAGELLAELAARLAARLAPCDGDLPAEEDVPTCSTCGEPARTFPGHRGWLHYRPGDPPRIYDAGHEVTFAAAPPPV